MAPPARLDWDTMSSPAAWKAYFDPAHLDGMRPACRVPDTNYQMSVTVTPALSQYGPAERLSAGCVMRNRR